MTFTIPDTVLAETKISSAELRIELAVYLYEKQRLSIGKARKVAGLNLIEFQKELAKRNVYLHLSIQDLDIDLKNLNSL
jgi:predicted HTH domain antitoxin